MSGYQTGGFPSNQSFVHFDKGITLVGGLADKPCSVVIREEDLVPLSIQEAIEQSDRRFAAIIQGIVDRAKESGDM